MTNEMIARLRRAEAQIQAVRKVLRYGRPEYQEWGYSYDYGIGWDHCSDVVEQALEGDPHD